MKYVWLTWLFACYPLGSAEFDYSVIIGMPKANVKCQKHIENNDCMVEVNHSVLEEDLRYFIHKQKRKMIRPQEPRA